MKHTSIAICLVAASLSLAACGGKSENKTETTADTTQTVADDTPYADASQTMKNEFSAGNHRYEITIHREADKQQPVVTDELGKKFYDNRVDVTITCDGQDFFKKMYTKDAFDGFLTEADKHGSVLLGMAFDSEKTQKDKRIIYLGAQVGQVGIEEGPAFSIEIPLDGSASSIVRDTAQDNTGGDMTD